MATSSTAGRAASSVSSVRKRILTILFISLVLDLLSFTLVLPLFPHLLTFYKSQPSSELLESIFKYLNAFKSTFHRPISERFDVVLLGGAMGSLFSLLQALASPIIGSLSDRYGRRTALLFSMMGNITSCVLWVFASTFPVFLASRVVGGLTEGNVQLAMAIATDISSPEERTSTLALVGVAFSIAFTFGPMVGAWMASKTLAVDNPFMTAALFSLGLIVVETVFIFVMLPETRPLRKENIDNGSASSGSTTTTGANTTTPEKSAIATREREQQDLKAKANAQSLTLLNITHFLFLLIFSGMEFSLTFMTYDLFNYSSAHNGRLLGFIGLFASLLQGGFVRRANPGVVTKMGLVSCALSFALLSRVETQKGLYAAAAFLAVTSATVVTGLTSLASMRIKERERGRALGGFRSAGQIGRASGPILFCTLYWWAGRTTAYSIGCAGMVAVCAIAWQGLVVPEGAWVPKGKKKAVIDEKKDL